MPESPLSTLLRMALLSNLLTLAIAHLMLKDDVLSVSGIYLVVMLSWLLPRTYFSVPLAMLLIGIACIAIGKLNESIRNAASKPASKLDRIILAFSLNLWLHAGAQALTEKLVSTENWLLGPL